MSTRATIKFTNNHPTSPDAFYVYRHCDGYPEDVLPDIAGAIDASTGRWSEPETECLVTLFLAMQFHPEKDRLPDYHITSGFHGDESYQYEVSWNKKAMCWGIAVLKEHYDPDRHKTEQQIALENLRKTRREYQDLLLQIEAACARIRKEREKEKGKNDDRTAKGA
jgi:hypothetical protein